MAEITAYKLFRERKDGSLGPLFINRKQVIPFAEWLLAECHPTKGFKVRPGWHCGARPTAPHLSKKGRIWCEVRIRDFWELKRPDHQGGLWMVANQILLVRRLTESEVLSLEQENDLKSA